MTLQETHKQALDSIVKTVESDFFGVTRFPPHQTRATAYFCYIIKNHPVTDGNRRLSVMWLQVYCNISSLILKPPIPLDELAIAVESSSLELDQIITITTKILFKNTKPIE